MASDSVALASLPKAMDFVPDASASEPIAVDSSPEAVAATSARASLPLASVLEPIAIAPWSDAFA